MVVASDRRGQPVGARAASKIRTTRAAGLRIAT
jgi:hypothetical protein